MQTPASPPPDRGPSRKRAREDDEAFGERSNVLGLSVRGPKAAVGNRFWTRRRQHALDIAAGIIVSSALAGLGMVVVDRVFRPGWDIPWSDHWLGAPLLFVSTAVIVGLLWTLLVLAERAVASAFPYSAGRRDFIRVSCHALMAGTLSWSTAVWTFSGKGVGETPWATYGPPLFMVAVMIVVALASWLGFRVDRQAARRRYSSALVLAGLYFLLSLAAFWADMNLYVALYERLHTLLEVAAFGFLMAALQAWGFVMLRRFPQLRIPNRSLGVALVIVAVVFVGYRPLRSYTDSLLSHAWVNQVYVGRTLKRAQLVQLTLDGGESLEMARVHHIQERFQVGRTRLADKWTAAAAPPSPQSLALRGGRKSVIFFYVDTLRYDVASDARVMPHLAEFSRQSLNFRAAYSAGSDTLRALPALTSGNYFVQQDHDGDLLSLAERARHESIFVGPLSASEFLKKHRPAFRFERRLTVEDYQTGKEVWGYGADRPTAAAIVDAGIEVLQKKSSNDPFLLWLFHFDQHAWRELDESYVNDLQATYGFSASGPIDVRYRLVARAIDEQFGRLLEALETTGHAEDTVVVFVSDHGEGMGREGFWVHSVFLWEELVHVPLLIRAPGVGARIIETPVSLVDVAQTLAPYLDVASDSPIYHGVDLFEFALGHEPVRQHPILMRGANHDRLERIGAIDPTTRRKLVLSLEAALPELYAVPGTDSREARNLARSEQGRVKALVNELASSPVFPRRIDDFDLLRDLGHLQAGGSSRPALRAEPTRAAKRSSLSPVVARSIALSPPGQVESELELDTSAEEGSEASAVRSELRPPGGTEDQPPRPP